MTALAVAALASCNRIDTPEMGSNALDISVRNGIGTKAVVEGTTLPDGSEIGLCVTDQTGVTYDGSNLKNVKYTASGEGESQKWNAAVDVLLSATVANIGSYYPYDESVYDITSIPIEATSEVQKDWMWGTPVSGLDNKNTSATINMSHALAAVRLNIIKGNFAGTGNIDYVSVKSNGAASSAVMNATTGELYDIKGAGYTFESTEEFILSESGTKVDFIVVPAGTEAPLDICVLVNGAEMIASTEGIMLEAGKIYEYTVSVGVDALQLNKLNITEWVEQEMLEQLLVPSTPIVNITGTTTDIRLEQTYANKTLTLKAIPKLDGYIVNEVTIQGGINTQTVDENGIRTIVITDIVSDVTVTFVGTTFVPWARIQHVDGTLYTAEEWLAAEEAGTVTDADANGVAVRYSKYASCPHIIHPKYSTNTMYLIPFSTNSTFTVVPDITITNNINTAQLDVNGKANTDAFLAAVAKGIITRAEAAQYCADITFANGQKGYLPAAGEAQAWLDNKTIVDSCMSAIGGVTKHSDGEWTSTVYDSKEAWYTRKNDMPHNSSSRNVRPVTSFSY